MNDHDRRDVVFPVQFSAETRGGRPTIRGHAAVFDSPTGEDFPFRETIAPGAFAKALARRSGQLLLFGHDFNSPLGRRPETLTLREDAYGLAFEAHLPDTTLARDVEALIAEGIIAGCSFGFTIAQSEERTVEGEREQRITEVGTLHEITLTAIPAYPDTSVSAREQVIALRSRAAGRRQTKTRIPVPNVPGDPYADGEHSWFRDVATVQCSEYRAALNMRPLSAGTDPGDPRLRPTNIAAARERLDWGRKNYERSALTLQAGHGGELVPAGMPPALSEQFTTAARLAGVMPEVLGSEPLPRGAGQTEKIPGFTSSALIEAEVQAVEGEAIAEQSPKTAWQTGGVEMLTATVGASQQVVDLAATPGFDEEITRELAAALATKRDQQILDGTGANGQTLGLLRVSGITATTFTQASPTGQQYVREGVAKCWNEVAATLGHRPDTILVSPTFWSWVYSGYDANKRPLDPHLFERFSQPIEVPAMPLKKGSNNNEQPTIVLYRDAVRLYLSEPRIVAAPDQSASGELIVRFTIRQLMAVVARRAVGIGVVLGTGVKEAPAFT